MKSALFILTIIFLAVFSLKISFAQDDAPVFQEETLEGRVIQILEEKEFVSQSTPQYLQKLKVLITRGSLNGRTVELESGTLVSSNSQKYKVKDEVIISYSRDTEGGDIFIITDYVRRRELLILFLIFAALAIVVGGIQGAASLIGMAFSFIVIFKFILPKIIAGMNPISVAVAGSMLIIPVTFVLSHGLKIKTFIAGLGTVITLIIVGIVAGFFTDFVHLTGFSREEASFLQYDLGNLLNMKGILLAGVIIASLGILDDITISQASVVSELKKADKSFGFTELFSKGMNVGRDHIASLVNTLVLVYTGASLPLLLLFINNPRPFSEVINYEMVAEEIVRTLVGSIGLISAVPVTTLIAAYYFQKSKGK